MASQQTILIAGGTGLLGKGVTDFFKKQGHHIKTLTRGQTVSSKGLFHWNPNLSEVTIAELKDVTIIINLAGADVMKKRWTAKRKQEILNSRAISTAFLSEIAFKLPKLKHFISASGITAYGFVSKKTPYNESDPIGQDFLATVIDKWERSCENLPKNVIKTILRIGVVFSANGGALVKLSNPIKMGFGAILGKGTQIVPWIDVDDLIGIISHVISNQIAGPLNCFTNCDTNKKVTHEIANHLKKSILLPPIPVWFLKIILGERSIIILEGVMVSNEKLLNTGYHFQFPMLKDSLQNQYKN